MDTRALSVRTGSGVFGGSVSQNGRPFPPKTVAVGTALSGGPPHRSVREELPHTAPTSGTMVGRRSVLLAVQQSDRRPTSSGTVSGMRLSEGRFPWSISFPPRTPLPEFRFCSSVSQVLRDRPTPRQRARRQYGHPAFTDRPIGECSPQGTAEVSRFSRLEFRRMLRFSDSAAFAGVSPITTPAVWPSPCQDKVGTRKGCFRSSMAGLPTLRADAQTRNVAVSSPPTEAEVIG